MGAGQPREGFIPWPWMLPDPLLGSGQVSPTWCHQILCYRPWFLASLNNRNRSEFRQGFIAVPAAEGGMKTSNRSPCLLAEVGANWFLLWGEGRGVFRGQAKEWPRWSVCPFRGVECGVMHSTLLLLLAHQKQQSSFGVFCIFLSIICLHCSYGCSDSKESACSAGDPGSSPGSGRSPGEGHGNPLQCSCLENPTDRGAWRASVHGVAESRTRLKQLGTHPCMSLFAVT